MPVFHFKQFSVRQDKCAMKVGTDGVLLGAWTDVSGAKKILDIGTGTGVIALMLAQKCGAQIDAIDIDESSCIQARENVAASIFKERINVLNKSLQEFIFLSPDIYRDGKGRDGLYDLIVSNPPYFSGSLKSPFRTKNISKHSDTAGLSSKELIDAVLKLLNKTGKFCLILPKTEGENFIGQAKNLHCTKLTKVFPTQKKVCSRLLMQFEFQKKEREENILIVENSPNVFTEEYKLLTKEFYLRLS